MGGDRYLLRLGDVKGESSSSTAAGSDPEWKYVPIRRLDAPEEEGALRAPEVEASEGICHGVTVLAWARVDGVSPLDQAPAGGGHAGTIEIDSFSWGVTDPLAADSGLARTGAGTLVLMGDPAGSAAYDPQFLGGVRVAEGGHADDVWVDGKIVTAPTPAVLDDVWVEGKIITAENISSGRSELDLI